VDSLKNHLASERFRAVQGATDLMKTFIDFPQRQAPGRFDTDQIIKQLEAARAAGQ